MYSFLKMVDFRDRMLLLGNFHRANEDKRGKTVKWSQKVCTNTREVGRVRGEDFVNDFISQIAPRPTIFPTDDRRRKPLPESGRWESVLSPLLRTDCCFNDDCWTWTLGFPQRTLFFPKENIRLLTSPYRKPWGIYCKLTSTIGRRVCICCIWFLWAPQSDSGPSRRTQCWGMDSVCAKGGKMVESDEQPSRDSGGGGGGGGAAMAALHQCELIQNMIEISISSLQGLRTKCAASNDLTQQEIRTLEVTSCSKFPERCPTFKRSQIAESWRLNAASASYGLRSPCQRDQPYFTLHPDDCGFTCRVFLWHSFHCNCRGLHQCDPLL